MPAYTQPYNTRTHTHTHIHTILGRLVMVDQSPCLSHTYMHTYLPALPACLPVCLSAGCMYVWMLSVCIFALATADSLTHLYLFSAYLALPPPSPSPLAFSSPCPRFCRGVCKCGLICVKGWMV